MYTTAGSMALVLQFDTNTVSNNFTDRGTNSTWNMDGLVY